MVGWFYPPQLYPPTFGGGMVGWFPCNDGDCYSCEPQSWQKIVSRASPAEWANRLIWHLLIAPAIKSQHWSDRPAKRAGKARSEGAKQQNGAEGRQRESLWGMQCGPFLITFCNDLVSFQIGVHRCLAPSVHIYTPVAPLESRGLRHSTPAKDLAPSLC